MKIEYDKEPKLKEECMAYIDKNGDLIVWDCAGTGGAVLLAHGHAESGFEFDAGDAEVKFYTGEKITITF